MSASCLMIFQLNWRISSRLHLWICWAPTQSFPCGTFNEANTIYQISEFRICLPFPENVGMWLFTTFGDDYNPSPGFRNCDYENFRSSLSGIPYLLQFFGIWAIFSSRFAACWFLQPFVKPLPCVAWVLPANCLLSVLVEFANALCYKCISNWLLHPRDWVVLLISGACARVGRKLQRIELFI